MINFENSRQNWDEIYCPFGENINLLKLATKF